MLFSNSIFHVTTQNNSEPHKPWNHLSPAQGPYDLKKKKSLKQRDFVACFDCFDVLCCSFQDVTFVFFQACSRQPSKERRGLEVSAAPGVRIQAELEM